MKYIFIIFLFIGLKANAANKYYASAAGSDGNACSLASPCRQMTKLLTLAATNDTLLLNGGDAFNSFVVNKSNVWIGSYGTGQPIITGFITLSGWTVISGNVYQAACSGCNVNTNLVLVNGVQYQMGRTPNTGYYTYQSFSGTTTITSSSLTGIPDYTGGSVVIRCNNSGIYTNKITGQSGSTLTYTSITGVPPTANFGLFITNDSLTLDAAYEWYYSPGTGNMKMYFPSIPSGLTVQTTGTDTLINISGGLKNITINNLDLEGAGLCGICMTNDTNVLVSNTKIRYSGGEGYSALSSVNSSTSNSYVQYCNDNGIIIGSASVNHYIGYDTVRNVGVFAGQGRTMQGNNYKGITNDSYLGVVEYSRVDTTGYDPIMGYQYSSIYHNSVDYFCFVIDDGGLYSLGFKSGADTARVQYIRGNVISNAIGAGVGTNNVTFQPAYGIYTDRANVNVVIDSNTIYNIAQAGIFNHDSRSITYKNNTVYNAKYSFLAQSDDAVYVIRNNVMKKNYFGVQNTTQQLIAFVNFNNIQFTGTFGTIDSNCYFFINSSVTPFLVYPSTNMSYKQWQDSSGDAHAAQLVTSGTILFQHNNSQLPAPSSLPGKYYDIINRTYYNNCIIPPFGSLFLVPGSFLVIPNQ